MVNALFLLGGIALIGYVVAFLDWLGRRQERKAHGRRTA